MNVLIWTVVIVAWFAQFGWLVRRILIAMERGKQERLYPRPLTNSDRGEAAMMAVMVAIFLPFVGALAYKLFDLITGRTNLLKTPTEVEREKRERAEAETKVYRENLRTLGMPDPMSQPPAAAAVKRCVYCGSMTSSDGDEHDPVCPRFDRGRA